MSETVGFLGGIVIAGLVAAWVYRDAESRGDNGIGWAFGVFMLMIVVLPIYFIRRKPKQPPVDALPHNTISSQVCRKCGAKLAASAKFCETCGTKIE